MTTLLILPGFAFLFFVKEKFGFEALKKKGLMAFVFLAALVGMYSYLPIRAGQQPLLNWGNPSNFERLLRHMTGQQYQVWLYSSFEAAKKQFSSYFEC